jgi:EAL domain-containing protein (putative c-di-GMP-specific phosphodiesterase class I)
MRNIENSISHAQKNAITNLTPESLDSNTLEKSIIENRIKEHSIAVALQDVYDIDKDIFHSEAYVRLFDENKEVHEAGDFMHLVHKMKLDTKLDQNVINYILKENSLQNRDIAINISLRFIQDPQSLQWLKERLAGVGKEKVLSFEISNHTLLTSLNEGFAFSDLLRKAGHTFGIDRFSIEEDTNLNYLQMLKPKYLKIDSKYLQDMLQGEQGQTNHALQILIESLDINIIATNLEDKNVKESLEKIGIRYFQGSLLSEPKLV